MHLVLAPPHCGGGDNEGNMIYYWFIVTHAISLLLKHIGLVDSKQIVPYKHIVHTITESCIKQCITQNEHLLEDIVYVTC